MGYTTELYGYFKLSKPLTIAQAGYLHAFAETRHVERNILTEKLEDPIRQKVGLPVGADGRFYVGDNETMNTDGGSVVDYNRPPLGVPSLYCQWIPTEDGEGIEWDGNEKFYEYVDWMQFLIDNFLNPWGIEVSGSVEYQGEEHGDQGTIFVKDGVVLLNEAEAEKASLLEFVREVSNVAVGGIASKKILKDLRDKATKILADIGQEV